MANLKIIVAVAFFLAPYAFASQTSDLEDNDFIKVDKLISFKSKKKNKILALIYRVRSGSEDWALYGYDGGPGTSNWGGVCSSGKAQSPIDFKTSDTRAVFRRVLRFTNAKDTPVSTNISNSGHSIKVKLITRRPILVSGGPFGENVYQFQQMHFHWGKTTKDGSEHTIATKRFPLEGHMVFYKSGSSNPAEEEDGIAVLGVQYDISPKDNPVLNIITDSIGQIITPSSPPVSIPGGLTLLDYLPKNVNSYFNYKGSLTTPPCSEAVNWIVFTDRSHVSEKQVSQFRRMKDELGYTVVYNFRETQPLNGRTVLLVKSSERVVS